MKKTMYVVLLALLIILLPTGCSIRYNVSTKATNMLRKDLMAISNSIKRVNFSFIRPQVDINIDMTEEPAEETLNTILEKVKSFATIENMNEIADKVKWGEYIWRVNLNINTDKNKETIEHSYSAGYLKSVDHSDQSDENIDGYKTWYKIQ